MAKGIIDNNGRKIEFEPPTPTIDKRGGIYADNTEDTSDMTEVVVGGDGKGYVPKVDLSDYYTKEEAQKTISKFVYDEVNEELQIYNGEDLLDANTMINEIFGNGGEM